MQFGSAIARTHFDAVGPTGAAALRLMFGALILAAVVRPSVRGWSGRTWLGVIMLGLALGGMNLLIYLAIDEIPLGVAVTIEFTGPLIVALVQTRRLVDGLWALVAFAGVLVLGLDSTGAFSPLGLLLAGAAALCWAGYIVASADLGGRIRGLDGLSVAMVVAALVVVPVGAAPAVSAIVVEPLLLVVFAVVAVLTSALPYALEFAALRRLPTRVFGVLSSLGPAVASIAGLVVLHEALGARQIIALVLVSAASAGVTVMGRRAPIRPSSPPPAHETPPKQ